MKQEYTVDRRPRRRYCVLFFFSAVIAVLPGPVTANPAATFKLGTLGPGLDITAGLGSSISLRAGINHFDMAQSFDLDDADVNGRLRWQTIPFLVDWFPASGGFRLSGGMIINNNRIKISAIPSRSFELSGARYMLESLDGHIRFASRAPYLGIGYGNPAGLEQRWHVAADFGVMFQGRPRVYARAVTAYPPLQEMVDRDLEEERAKFEEDISSFRFYPVMSLGISRRF